MIDLEIREDPSGVLFHVVVKPKARRNAILGIADKRLKIAVTAPPEKGKANSALIALLADFFGIAKGRVSIKSGETSHIKFLMLEGVTAKQLVDKLSEIDIG